MPFGWTGKILRVDLTKEKVTKESTMAYTKDFIGGRGINAAVLYNEVKTGTDPFDPENRLIFGTGPLTGTMAPASGRNDMASKSPITGLTGISNFGGFFGAELKFAGYDHIVFQGKSKGPVFLWINNENVEIRSAGNLWGLDTFKTMTAIREELGDPEVKVASIGPGGERLIRFASIVHDLGDGAGRLGTGAVMGSKNLKAIAVRGTGGIKVANPKGFLEVCLEKFRKIMRGYVLNEYGYTDKSRQNYEDAIGDTYWAAWGNKERVTWPRASDWAPTSEARQEVFVKKYGLRARACFNCPIGCMVFAAVPDVGVCFQSCQGFMEPVWGLRVPDQKFGFKFARLCEMNSVDILTTVHTISWLTELYERRIITEKDTDGVPMEAGDPQAILTMFGKIIKREGIGDILAEGPFRAAKVIGRGTEEFVMGTPKGLTDFGHDVRSMKGIALANAVGPRGDNVRAQPDLEWSTIGASEKDTQYALKLAVEITGTKEAANRLSYEGKAPNVIYIEHEIIVWDLMGICKWTSPWLCGTAHAPFTSKDLTELFVACTGVNLDVKDVLKIAERVRNLERAFDVREGLTRERDSLAKRFYNVPLPDGPYKGEKVDREKFEKMKDEYYTLRGWNLKTGAPTRKKLEELGLKHIADDLEALGKIKKA